MDEELEKYLLFGFNDIERGFVWSTYFFGMRFAPRVRRVIVSLYYPYEVGVLHAFSRETGGRRFGLERGMNRVALTCGEGSEVFNFGVSPRRVMAEDVRELGVMLTAVDETEGVELTADEGVCDDWTPPPRRPVAAALARHLLESFIRPGFFLPHIVRRNGKFFLAMSVYLPPEERAGAEMILPISLNGTLYEVALRREVFGGVGPPLLSTIRYYGLLSLTELGEADGYVAPFDLFLADARGAERLAWQSAHWRAAGADAVPEDEHIYRVAGPAGAYFFLFGGATWCVKMIRLYEALTGRGIEDCGRILDWGVGCGRIARFFPEALRGRVTGVDIDAVNIAWCRENLPWMDAHVTAPAPPLPFANGVFELVFGHSVLTHLSEADQHVWLAELARVTRPGGLVLLTVLSELSWFVRFFPNGRTPEHIAEYLDTGFVDDGALDVGVDASHPGVYRNVSHSTPYIRRVWSEYFEIVEIIHAFADLQSLVVCRRR